MPRERLAEVLHRVDPDLRIVEARPWPGKRRTKMRRYDDLLADVRHDYEHHSIRSLVQVDDPEVREVARVLVQASDFISEAQGFVNPWGSKCLGRGWLKFYIGLTLT
ncbi:unnamed protein product [marine sediment metagenome]|uniref:Uncharacterized protein n=1 Tax=marine sediment metagenome TaxID=412755 RepID=X1Q307_9ZZZZ